MPCGVMASALIIMIILSDVRCKLRKNSFFSISGAGVARAFSKFHTSSSMDSVLGKRSRGGNANESEHSYSLKLPRATLAATSTQIVERIKLITEAFLQTDTSAADEETLLLSSVYAKELELMTSELAESAHSGRLSYQVLKRNSWQTFRAEKEEAAGGLFHRTFRMSPVQFDALFAHVKAAMSGPQIPNAPREESCFLHCDI